MTSPYLLRKQRRERKFTKEKQQTLKKIASLSNFVEHSKLERSERLRLCENDFWQFCRTYLPMYFSVNKQALWHSEMVESLQLDDETTVIAAPRGFSKSTIVSFAFVLWCICFQKRHFVVIAMDSYTKATMQTWRILLQLKYNHRIIADFGKIVDDDASRADFTTIVTSDRPTGIRVCALGSNMSARGIVNEQFRPDLFICDDLQSKKLARNPKRVEFLLYEIIISDYFGSMCATGGWFVVLGTILAVDDVMYQLINSDDHSTWVRRLYRAIEIDEQGSEYSTWEELHPLTILLKKRRKMGFAKFEQEYQNNPQENDGRFKEKDFRYASDLPPDLDLGNLIAQVDPSYSELGDHKAMVIGTTYKMMKSSKHYGKVFDDKGLIIDEDEYAWAVELINRKMSIDEMIQLIYTLHKRWKPKMWYVDGTYSQKVVFKREFARYAAMPKYYKLPIKYISQSGKGKKVERILSELETMVAGGTLILPSRQSPDTRRTVTQFARLGDTAINDDGPDVIAAWKANLPIGGKRKTKVMTM
jgi:hypothetical protein